MDRTQKIVKRQRKINEGAMAETALASLDPTFETTKEILLKKLIENTKSEGKVDEFSVYMLTALHDLKFVLTEQIRIGKNAAEARRKEVEERERLEAAKYE